MLIIYMCHMYGCVLCVDTEESAMGCGSGSVILLRPKMGLVPPKHDVISMPTQQYTNTEHIPMERYHPVVSIMLSYMSLKNAFGENLCCREVKIDKNF